MSLFDSLVPFPSYTYTYRTNSRPVFEHKFELDLAGIDPVHVSMTYSGGIVKVKVKDEVVYEVETAADVADIKAVLKHGLLTVEAVPAKPKVVAIEISK